MSFSRPIQWYNSHADPIWPDSTFKFGSMDEDDLHRLNNEHLTENVLLQSLKTTTGKIYDKPRMKLEKIQINATRARKYTAVVCCREKILEKKTVYAPDLQSRGYS
jgi:hypothetical protein